MCGIVGYTGNTSKDLIKSMCRTLTHRGPDSEGYFVDDDIAFGMRRLKIIDLDSGDQPLFNSRKTSMVIFNGEIYNFKELQLEFYEANPYMTPEIKDRIAAVQNQVDPEYSKNIVIKNGIRYLVNPRTKEITILPDPE